jgi:hypothetical protein
MEVRLAIGESAYVLLESRSGHWAELATLEGGSGALLPAGRRLDEGRLEAAIEVAEDWFMPHAAGLRGKALDVIDPTGRLSLGLEQVLSVVSRQWSVEDLEHLFLRLVDMTTGRSPHPAVQGREGFVADVLLLRELAHHGQLREVRLA